MLNENRNNMHWKDKLENTADLQGEIVKDKEAAWRKLQSQLHQKPHRKRIVPFWIAAACVLLIVSVPLIFMQNDTKDNMVKKAFPANAKTILTKQVPLVKKEAEAVVITTVVPSTRKEIIKQKTEKKNGIVAVIPTNPSVINNSDSNSITSYTTPAAVDSSSSTTIAAVQLKNRLQVVHINELGDPIQEAQSLAHTVEQHSFEMQFAKEEVVSNTAVTLNKTRFGVITIKPSTN